MSETETPDCPLCMETFEVDDLHFYPCTCGYQICRFCWHRIRTDENGLCPACRKTYSEDPAMYRPLSQDEIQKIKKERKQQEALHKQKISANRQHLSNIRVIQKHLVFVVGLSNKMADAEILKRPEYFGKYGKILKIVINPNTNYAGPQGPSASAYITYTKEEDALKAILSINTMQPPLKIRASLGTTKYCTHYLRNMQCPKTDCMYLHDVGDGEASFTKEDMQAGKHQQFEKNLIDNYVNSTQQQRKLTKSISETSEPDHVEVNSIQEDWSDEVENGDSLLPSQASWGSSKEMKHITDVDKSVNSSQQEDYPDLESTSKSSPPSAAPVATVSSVEEVSQNITATLDSREEEKKPKQKFSTGWDSTTESTQENVLSNDVPNSNTLSWPGILDLGLSDLQINPSDDGLDFDPFNESKTGLEDLMATEKQLGTPAQPQPSFSWESFWPTNYAATQNPMSMLSSYSLFGASSQSPSNQMPQYRPPPMNPYQHSMMAGANPMNPMTQQFRFMPPQQPMQRLPQQAQPPAAGNNPLVNQQPFMNPFRFPQPPHQPGAMMPLQQQQTAPVTTTASMPPSLSNMSTDNKNWQDGLRALLPNINISFANQQQQQQNERLAAEQSQTVDAVSSVASPPPGFAGFAGLPIKPVEKQGTRPPPPPGFAKPDVLPSPSSHPTPGILNIAPPAIQASVTSVVNSVTDTTVTAATSHEDPSILWSKVLSDKHKQIDTMSMAFPLPGETLKQGSNIDASATNRAPQQIPMTSWNTIVSGNQVPKILSKSFEDEANKQRQPLQISAKETGDAKPQKPSPIFGSQQKQSVKKPTAHVKPLKCTAPSDGFTTVQGSRPFSSQQPNGNINTGSRISELDDFSTDFAPGVSANGLATGVSTEFPAVTKTASKKKKRKNKEHVEQIAEIVVGRVEAERPPIGIVDEERPKKGAKTKKKASQKASPPQQRKSPVLQQKEIKEQPAPTIRILKSDGSHSGTAMQPPVQATASNDQTAHDNEIVSRLTESTEKLLKNVLFETEAIKINTEQISKDLKSALEKCKESSLSLSDLEKINLLLTPGKLSANDQDDSDLVDTTDLERQVESARREAKMLEARLNDVIRKNMASELETLKRNTKGGGNNAQ